MSVDIIPHKTHRIMDFVSRFRSSFTKFIWICFRVRDSYDLQLVSSNLVEGKNEEKLERFLWGTSRYLPSVFASVFVYFHYELQ